MGSLSDFAEKELLDHVCNTAYTRSATVYLALLTADATDAGTGATITECADAFSYARTAIAFLPAAARSSVQTGAVTFPQASGGGWGDVTHWAILDGNTHGADDVLAHGAFTATKTVNDGNTPSVASGEIDVTFSANEISDVLAHNLLDLMFDDTAYAIPDTFIGLCTATIDDNDTGSTVTEVSGGSYARKEVDVNGGASPTWDLATGTSPALVDNTHEISFVTATANWGTVVAVGIFSAVTAGDLLFYDNAMVDQDVDDGDTAKFPVGDLDITLD